MKGVSIVICCYNSAIRLPQTLQHIAAQKVPAGISWELLIVNNNSSDDTVAVSNAFFAAHPEVKGCVLHEQVAGLSYARQKGFDHARYDYIVLCDDDNWLCAEYVHLSYRIMESDEQIASLGGWGKPVFETAAPRWFQHYADYYATGPQHHQSGDITHTRSFVYGAGAVFRRPALLYLKERGFKNLLTDRKGTSLVTGGDNELGYALVLAGYKIWYDERLLFQHFIPAGRVSFSYFLRLVKYNAYSKFLLLPYDDLIHSTKRAKYKYSFAWTFLSLFFLFVKDDLLRIPQQLLNNTFFKFKVSVAGRLGMLKALLEHTGYHYRTLNELRNASWHTYR